MSTNPSGHLVSQRLSLSNSPLNSETTPVWPRYTQKHDKHAVLDALSSTIKPITPPLMFGHGPSDPYFLHNSRLSLLQYAQYWLAGKNAANYVIDRNPGLFPGFRAVPEVVPDTEPPPTEEPSLERLENQDQGLMAAAQNTLPMPDTEDDSSSDHGGLLSEMTTRRGVKRATDWNMFVSL